MTSEEKRKAAAEALRKWYSKKSPEERRQYNALRNQKYIASAYGGDNALYRADMKLKRQIARERKNAE